MICCLRIYADSPVRNRSIIMSYANLAHGNYKRNIKVYSTLYSWVLHWQNDTNISTLKHADTCLICSWNGQTSISISKKRTDALASYTIPVDYYFKHIYLCNQCLSPLTLWVRTPLRQRVLDACKTLCDKVCQWLATCRWFSPGTPVSSTNKLTATI